MMKRFFVALVIALALTGSVAVGASAHNTTPTLTCVNAFGSVISTTANVCPVGTVPLATGLRCVQPDGVIIDTTANFCPGGDVPLATDGLAFGGPFGARFFQPGFDFGTLSDQQAAQDANTCAENIAFITSLHLGPVHRALALKVLADNQACQNRTGSNNSFSFWP